MIVVRKLENFDSVVKTLRAPHCVTEGEDFAVKVYRFGEKNIARLAALADRFDSAKTGQLVVMTEKDAKLILAATYESEGEHYTYIVETGNTRKMRRAIVEGAAMDIVTGNRSALAIAFTEAHPRTYMK